MTRSIASNPNHVGAAAHWATSRLALLWLVVALVCQGFVIQTHAHAGVERNWAAATSALATAAADDQKHSPAAPVCPLCEEQALFGAYLLSGSVTFAKPVDAAIAYAAVSFAPFLLRLSAHGWRNRGPPPSTI